MCSLAPVQKIGPSADSVIFSGGGVRFPKNYNITWSVRHGKRESRVSCMYLLDL